MSYLPDKGYKRILIATFYIILAIIAIWLFVKYLIKPLLPFICAWIIALFLQPVINSACRRSKLPRRAISFILVFITLTAVISGFYFISSEIISEIRGMATDLSSDINGVISDIFAFFDSLSSKLSISDGSGNARLRGAIREFANSSVNGISAKLPSKIMAFVASLPGIIFFLLVLIVASFYMSLDFKKVNAFFGGLLPDKMRIKLRAAKDKMVKDGLRYIRAYLIILVITFLQLLCGFMLLKIPYALTLALIIAFIDILPVLGVGTVLLPWAGVLLIRHNYYLGIGLIIVFAVIYISRQIAEPKIVSVSIGLSPLVTLASMYVGIKLMGVGGIFVFPLGVIFFKNLIDCGVFKADARQNTGAQTAAKQKKSG